MSGGRAASAPVAPRAARRAAHLRLLPGGASSRGTDRARGRRDRISTRGAILLLTGALCVIGLVMVLSASAYTSEVLYHSVWTIFERQVLWMAIGAIALFAAARVRYEHWRRFRIVLLVGTFALLVAVLVPGLGVSSGGSSRWIGVGMARIQPSEAMKLALAVFAADLLTRRADRVNEARIVVAPLLIVMGAAAVLLLKQPDMGTAIVLVCITFALLYAGGVPPSAVFKTLGVTAVLGLVVGLAQPYRRDRLLSFVHPFAKAKGAGYQVVQSLVGLGSGHLFGLGLGGSHEKWGLLPNAHTDFIFSIVGEETGLVGAVLVLALFGGLAFYGLRTASRAPDRFGSLLAVAATAWITSQALINIGTTVGVLPVTGIPLPFISFGGSSLVVTMVAVGILVNIAGRERRAGAPAGGARPAAATRSAAATRAGGRSAGPTRRPAR
ncbi:MAG TPA: putative lipid II flippase FtsW [Acidimicrobiales bacterium]|nr:putative lipid II flippase FtsW [Acidimicrobiales bacterium]